MKLNVQMLGRFAVRLEGLDTPLVIPRQKAAALLAILASTPGKAHPRETLATLLWGRNGDTAARNNLRQTLFVVRRALPEFPGLLVNPDCLALDRACVQSDVDVFESKAAETSMNELETAVGLYAGPFLHGLSIRDGTFGEWRVREADRLALIYLSVHERLMQGYVEQKRHSDAIRTALRALRIDSFHEAANETLVVAYAAQGRMAQARQQYENFARLLLNDLGLSPSRTLRDLLSDGQNLRSVSQRPRNNVTSPALGAALTTTPIAIVAPFESSGRSSAPVAEALGQELVGAIGRALPLPVVGARTESGSEASDLRIPDLAERTGARYVVHGRVWSLGDRWRANFRLIEAATERQSTSGSAEYVGDDPFCVVDALGTQIAAAAVSSIELNERKRALYRSTDSLDVWDRCCRGMALLDQLSCSTVLPAQDCFREAMEIAPHNARVLAGLSQAVVQEGVCHVGRSREETFSEGLDLALQAYVLDRHDPFVNWTLGKAYQRAEQFEQAVEPLERALRITPDNPDVCGTLGNLLSFMGKPEKGIPLVRLSLDSTDSYLSPMARSYLQMRDYENARIWSEKAIQTHPSNSWAYVLLASTLGHLGKKGEAYHALQQCEALHQGRVNAEFEAAPTQYGIPHDHDHVLAGVEKAGWRH